MPRINPVYCEDCGARLRADEMVFMWDDEEWLCEECFSNRRIDLDNSDLCDKCGWRSCLVEDLLGE